MLCNSSIDCSGSAPAPAPVDDSFIQGILSAHNAYRSALGVGESDLIWDVSLASGAQGYAQTLSNAGTFQHSGTNGVGENLWMGTSGIYTNTQMVDSWGSEKQYFTGGNFPWSRTNNFEDVGHYTQMIWKNTVAVGCGAVDGQDNNSRLVCWYNPPGNVIGEHAF